MVVRVGRWGKLSRVEGREREGKKGEGKEGEGGKRGREKRVGE